MKCISEFLLPNQDGANTSHENHSNPAPDRLFVEKFDLLHAFEFRPEVVDEAAGSDVIIAVLDVMEGHDSTWPDERSVVNPILSNASLGMISIDEEEI